MAKEKTINKHEVRALTLLETILGIPPYREFRFHPTRRWRFDFAYPDIKLAIEIEGGTWIGGRHIHPIGFEKDCEKYNAATILGWRVLRCTPKQLTLEYLGDLLVSVKADSL